MFLFFNVDVKHFTDIMTSVYTNITGLVYASIMVSIETFLLRIILRIHFASASLFMYFVK